MAKLFYYLMVSMTAMGIGIDLIYILGMLSTNKKAEVLGLKQTWSIVHSALKVLQWGSVFMAIFTWLIVTGRPLEECLTWYGLISSTLWKLALAWGISFVVFLIFLIIYMVSSRGYNLKGAGCATVLSDSYTGAFKTAAVFMVLAFLLQTV